jgi:prephenate dehydratase
MLVFTVKHEAGALAEAINIIGKYGYNMRGLHSRPMKELMWQYYFYLEAEGDIRRADGEAMMAELSTVCDKLKLVGSYEVR